jgi:Tfp pilus assembly protein FimV
MQQYQQKSPVVPPSANTATAQSKAVTESQSKIALLENQLWRMQMTIDLQSRQIRRLESALNILESAVGRK